jgi:hypothetical protein
MNTVLEKKGNFGYVFYLTKQMGAGEERLEGRNGAKWEINAVFTKTIKTNNFPKERLNE